MRTPLRFILDADIAYVAMRYRHLHDYWHTLLGVGISVECELLLKLFELYHADMPVAGLSALAAPLLLPPSACLRLARVGLPWASRAACVCVSGVCLCRQRVSVARVLCVVW